MPILFRKMFVLLAGFITLSAPLSLRTSAAVADAERSNQERRKLRAAEIEKADQVAEIEARDHSWIGYESVSVPLQRFLLIRREKHLCAIRFISFYRKPIGKQIKTGADDRVARFAEYDWYYQSDGSNDLGKHSRMTGRSKVARIPVAITVEEFVRQGEPLLKKLKPVVSESITCGPFALYWYYPTGVQFGSDATPRD